MTQHKNEKYLERLEASLTTNQTDEQEALQFFNRIEDKNEQQQVIEFLVATLELSPRVELRKQAAIILALVPYLFEEDENCTEKCYKLLDILCAEGSEEVRKLISTLFSVLIQPNDVTAVFDKIISLFEQNKSIYALEAISGIELDFLQYSADKTIGKKLIPVFKQCLQDKNAQVRHLAVSCSLNLCSVIGKDFKAQIQEFLPLVLGVLQLDLNSGDQEGAELVLTELTRATTNPLLFAKSPEIVVSAMYQIAKQKALQPQLRIFALRFLGVFVADNKAATKKMKKFNETMLHLCMDISVETVDEDQFESAIHGDDLEETLFDTANFAISAFAEEVGGKSFAPLALQSIQQYLQRPDWKSKVAGLMVIYLTAEACQPQFEPHLGSLLDAIISQLHAENARLRYVANHCLGQLAHDNAEIIYQSYGQKIFNTLLDVLDEKHDSVLDHVHHAIISMMQLCPQEALHEYLVPFLQKLMRNVSKGTSKTRQSAIGAIGALINHEDDLFNKYYSTVMNMVKENLVLEKDNGVTDRLVECASLIMLASAENVPTSDMEWLMNVLNDIKVEDWTVYTLDAYGRAIVLMKEKITPYLKEITTRMEKKYFEKEKGSFREIEKHDEAKNSIIGVAADIAEFGGAAAVEYYPLFMRLFQGAVNSFTNDSRVEAYQFAGDLLKYAKEQNYQDFTAMFAKIAQVMVSVGMDSDEYKDACSTADLLAEYIASYDTGNLHLPDIAESLSQSYSKQLLLAAAADIQDEQNNEQDDDDDEEEPVTRRDTFAAFAQVVKRLLEKYSFNSAFLYNSIGFNTLVGPGRPDTINYGAFEFISAAIEGGKERTRPYYNYFLQLFGPIFDCVSHLPEAQQLFAYTWGLLAQYGADAVDPFFTARVQMIMDMGEDEEVDDGIRCNIVSAMLKTLKYHDSKYETKYVTPARMEKLLTYMPLSEDDEDEKVTAMKLLLELVEEQNKVLLGENRENLNQIKFILFEWKREITDIDVVLRITQVCETVLM